MGVSLLDDIRFVLGANQSSVLILRMLLVQRIQSISSNVASDAGAGQNLSVYMQFARAEKEDSQEDLWRHGTLSQICRVEC